MTKPLFDVFRDAVMRAPERSRKEAFDYFLERVASDPAYLELLAREYFDRTSGTWGASTVKHGFAFARTPAAEVKIERARQTREESAMQTAAALGSLKARIRKVILLDLTLPNGKTLRHATGAECAKAGGFYSEVAKHIKPTQVVDKHLSEANLQDIRSRYFQRNQAKAA